MGFVIFWFIFYILCIHINVICRFATLRRRTAHRLAKLQARDHVVQGMTRALARIDQIIALMKSSADSAAAREALTSETYGFSLEQVRYLYLYMYLYLCLCLYSFLF